MRSAKEVDNWIRSNYIKEEDLDSIRKYTNKYYPSVPTIFNLSDILGLTMADFLEFVNSESPKESRDIYSLLQETNSLLKEIRDGITKFPK